MEIGLVQGKGPARHSALADQISWAGAAEMGTRQRKTNLFLQLPRVLAHSFVLPASSLPAAELSPALLSQLLSSLDCLFNLKPLVHAASPRREPVLPTASKGSSRARGSSAREKGVFSHSNRDSRGEGSVLEGLMRSE